LSPAASREIKLVNKNSTNGISTWKGSKATGGDTIRTRYKWSWGGGGLGDVNGFELGKRRIASNGASGKKGISRKSETKMVGEVEVKEEKVLGQ